MNLLILPSWYRTAENPSGGAFIRAQALALQEAGLQVGVLFGDWGPHVPLFPVEEAPRERLPTLTARGFFPPRRFRPLQRAWLRKHLLLFERYLQSHPHPDLLHAHGYPAAQVAAAISQATGTPYIVTLHYSGFLGEKISERLKKELAFSLRNAKAILVISRALATALERHGLEFPTKCVPNLVDEALFTPRPQKKSARKTVRFVTVGSLIPRKGHLWLVETFADWLESAKLPAELHIVGEGPLEGNLRKAIRRLGLGGRVRLHSERPPEALNALLDTCDVFLLPSRAETFGVALAEALMKGLPAVVNRCGGPEEFFTPDCGRLVDVEAPTAWHQALEHMASHHTDYASERIRAHALQLFGKAAVVPRLMEIYASVLH